MVKRSDLFVASGEGNYWFPRILPAEPNLVKIHDNVHVTSDVYFNTHSVMQCMFGVVPDYYQMLPESVRKSRGYPYYSGGDRGLRQLLHRRQDHRHVRREDLPQHHRWHG